jgi:histidinol-phosphate aminotransferase
MTLGIRKTILGIADYSPGGAPRNASDAKLSSNENPFSPLPSVCAIISEAALAANRYPDNECIEVREKLSALYDIAPEGIAIGCGSIGLLRQALLALVDPGDEVIYGWPSFEAYPILCAQVGAKSIQVALTNSSLNLAAIAKAVSSRTKIIIVCNPNNPTGTIVTRESFERFLSSVPSDVLVVLDEAYFELSRILECPDGLDYVARYPNVLVLRSMSKAFGLAALRIGYAVASPDLIRILLRTSLPFAVSSIAQAAAIASIDHYEELLDRVTSIVSSRDRLQQRFSQLEIDVPESQANFFWLPIAGGTDDLYRALRAQGVITRPRPPHGLRISIGTEEDNFRMMHALEKYFSAKP